MEHDPKLARVCRALVHPRIGMFRKLLDIPRGKGASEIFVNITEMVDPRYFQNLSPVGVSGITEAAGAGLSRSEAQWSALGEGVERFVASICPSEACIVDTYENVADRAVDPGSFIVYSADQYAQPDFPFQPFDPTKRRRWTSAIDLQGGECRLVPAHLVWLGLDYTDPNEPVRQSVSSGVACGAGRKQCVHSALREVIERDAFMATWLLKRSPPKLLVNSDLFEHLDPRVVPLLGDPLLRTDLRLLTTDLESQTVLALVGPIRGGRRVVGAAAHPDLSVAIRKAVIEAHHTWAWSLHLGGLLAAPAAPDIDSFAKHVRFYLEAENQQRLAFLDDGEAVDPPWATFDTVDIELRWMLDDLAKAGHQALFIDLTTRDIAELDLHVGRVIVPGLHPLSCGTRFSCLDDRRLRRIAQAWTIPMPPTLNLDPHPFP